MRFAVFPDRRGFSIKGFWKLNQHFRVKNKLIKKHANIRGFQKEKQLKLKLKHTSLVINRVIKHYFHSISGST